MLIASKMEEILPPTVHDFAFITDNAFQKDDVIKMEQQVLKTLNYELCYPTPIHFLRRYSKALDSGPEVHTYAKYLLGLR